VSAGATASPQTVQFWPSMYARYVPGLAFDQVRQRLINEKYPASRLASVGRKPSHSRDRKDKTSAGTRHAIKGGLMVLSFALTA
jgi:hypothetical protein